MSLYFWNGTLLFRESKVAKSASCCCEETCCGLDSDDTLVCTLESDDCSAIDGVTWDLAWDVGDGRWQGNPTDFCFSSENTPAIGIWCDEELGFGDWRDFQAVENLGPAECPDTYTSLPDPDSGSCSPFELRFIGEITESSPGECGCNCESYPAAFTIVITLKP